MEQIKTTIKPKTPEQKVSAVTVGVAGIVGIGLISLIGVGLILWAVYKLLDKHGSDILKTAPLLLI